MNVGRNYSKNVGGVVCMLSLAVAMVVGPTRGAAQDEPKMTRVVLKIHTGEDGKEEATRFTCRVLSADGHTWIASYKDAEFAKDDRIAFPPNSDQTINLIVVTGKMEKSNCQKFKVDVTQSTKTSDTWKMKPTAVMYFTDGSTITAEGEAATLKGDNAKTLFQAR